MTATPRISIFHEFHRPPYGGGNQFLLALRAEFVRRGWPVDTNRTTSATRACIFNSFNFEVAKLRRARRPGIRMLHRVDGPIGTYRGTDNEIDRRTAEMNDELADVTVFQSHYSLAANEALGLSFVDPHVVMNAPDSSIFYARPPRASDLAERRVRLISSSWSDNPNKGAPTYSWLDKHLDFGRYSYVFVGRSPIPYERIEMVPPRESRSLARLLRSADVYITASLHDPCSNALIEALSCGLPAIYARSGGHPEIVGRAGFGFDVPEEIPDLLEQLVAQYEERVRQIRVPTIDEVADQYLALLDLPAYPTVLSPSTTVQDETRPFGRSASSVTRAWSALLPARLRDAARDARDSLIGARAWLSASARPGEVAVSYGGAPVPPPGALASGGSVKLQQLQQAFPDTRRGFNVVYLVSSYLPAGARQTARRARSRGARLVWNQNGVAYPGWHGPGWERTNAPMATLLEAADYVLYQSQFCKRAADTFLSARRDGRWEVLYNPVDTTAFVPLADRPSSTPLTLLIAGSHKHAYRVSTALEVLRLLLDARQAARLVVAGSLSWDGGPKQAMRSTEALIERLELEEHVSFLGRYTQAQAPAIFQQGQILLHTQYNDASPTVVLEALASGLPVVYSASGGVPELVGPEAGVGVAVEETWDREIPLDPARTAEAIQQVRDRWPSYAEAARQRAIDCFDVRQWIQRHREIFDALCR